MEVSYAGTAKLRQCAIFYSAGSPRGYAPRHLCETDLVSFASIRCVASSPPRTRITHVESRSHTHDNWIGIQTVAMRHCEDDTMAMERLAIPPEFSTYAEEKGIFTLYEGMLEALLTARPECPLQFLSHYLSMDRARSGWL